MTEAQLYQLSHQVEACKMLAKRVDALAREREVGELDFDLVHERIEPQPTEELWRLRRDQSILASRRQYEANVLRNELVSQHDLCGYVDHKLATEHLAGGAVVADLSARFMDDGATMTGPQPEDL